jgi:hypothetical protein
MLGEPEPLASPCPCSCLRVLDFVMVTCILPPQSPMGHLDCLFPHSFLRGLLCVPGCDMAEQPCVISQQPCGLGIVTETRNRLEQKGSSHGHRASS